MLISICAVLIPLIFSDDSIVRTEDEACSLICDTAENNNKILVLRFNSVLHLKSALKISLLSLPQKGGSNMRIILSAVVFFLISLTGFTKAFASEDWRWWAEGNAQDFLTLCAAMNGNITYGYHSIDLPEEFEETIKAVLNELVTFDCLEAVHRLRRPRFIDLTRYHLTELRPLMYFPHVVFAGTFHQDGYDFPPYSKIKRTH